MPRQTCKVCGVNSNGEYCFRHNKRKPLVAKNPTNDQKRLIMEEISSMRKLFVQIWKMRPHKSEVSNDNLGKEPLTVFFHHILPKSKYPDAAFDEENIILLTLDEHTNVENNMHRYDEVNTRRDALKLKYEIS
jgi:hypothetical protein